MRKSVTIADVAQAAGVSRVAASAVINGARTSARVSPATRERVLEAARTLHYIPNAAAQSLTRPGMNQFGVAFNRSDFSFFGNPYAVSVLEGILNAATASDFNVTLFNKPWIDAAHSAAPYGNGRIDGLIVVAPLLDSDMVPKLSAMGLPLVLVAATASTWDVPAVSMDNVQGGEVVAQHLLSLGHTEIGFVSAGSDEERVPDARDRRRGFLGALAAAGHPVPDERIASGNFNRTVGYDAACTLLTRPDPPTAIFAANDFSALGVLKAAQELGIRVPDQLSVIGFDDIGEASHTTPPLTTVRNPATTMGRHAAELLIAQISGEPVDARTYFYAPELVVRASTAAPRIAV